MFEDWKQAWRQAVENFQRELEHGDAGAPPRLRALEREITSAAGALRRLDEEITRSTRDLDGEREAGAVCLRRERLAADVADDETARIASEFAARHAERAAVLERKIAVLQDERALLARDVELMRGMLGEAASRDSIEEPDSAPVTGGTGGSTDSDHAFSRLERETRERAAGDRLEELKRKMRG